MFCSIAGLCNCIIFHNFFQSDTEFERLYLTRLTPQRQNITKLFKPSSTLESYPESIDWRTKGAVSSVRDQVSLQCFFVLVFGAKIHLFVNMPKYCRVNVELVMHSVLWELWREPGLWLMASSLHSASRIS